MNNVNFGVIGAGHIGKRHMEMIRRKEGFSSWPSRTSARKRACEVDGDVPHYSDHKAMLEAHPELDVVCVCTPNGFHAQQAIDAISSNCHVVIEKPMALTRADGEAVLHAALAKGKQVFCAAQNRYSPPSVWLRDVIQSGPWEPFTWFRCSAIGTEMTVTTARFMERHQGFGWRNPVHAIQPFH